MSSLLKISQKTVNINSKFNLKHHYKYHLNQILHQT